MCCASIDQDSMSFHCSNTLTLGRDYFCLNLTGNSNMKCLCDISVYHVNAITVHFVLCLRQLYV